MNQPTANNSTALATIAAEGGFTPAQVDLIRTQIAPEATNDQLAFFLEVCRGVGLNPFMRQIYAVFRNSNTKGKDGEWDTVKRMTIQTGIDGYRLLAARTGQLAGIDDAVYDTEDATHPNKATVTVYRFIGGLGGQRVAFTATARWNEYVQTKDEYVNGKKTGNKVPTEMWAKMPYLMLAKCAEALALRKAFPAELSGVYTHEEMAQADNDGPLPMPIPAAMTGPRNPNDQRRPYRVEDDPAEEHEADLAEMAAAAGVANANERASEDDQLELAQWLHEAKFGKLSAAARFLVETLGHSRVKVRQLEEGHADITTDEVGVVIAALAARREAATEANGDEDVSAADESYDLAALGGGARPS